MLVLSQLDIAGVIHVGVKLLGHPLHLLLQQIDTYGAHGLLLLSLVLRPGSTVLRRYRIIPAVVVARPASPGRIGLPGYLAEYIKAQDGRN
jgi:hypothetical protein